eukprot:5634770-Amphidinium_carterae.1
MTAAFQKHHQQRVGTHERAPTQQNISPQRQHATGYARTTLDIYSVPQPERGTVCEGVFCQPEIETAHFVRQVAAFGLGYIQHEGFKDIKPWSYRFCPAT